MSQLHYVVNDRINVTVADWDTGQWFHVWQDGKAVGAYRTDTEAIAHADELANVLVADLPTWSELEKANPQLFGYTDDWTDALGCDIATLERARSVAVATDELLTRDDTELTSERLSLWQWTLDDQEELLTDTLLLAWRDANGCCRRHYSSR